MKSAEGPVSISEAVHPQGVADPSDGYAPEVNWGGLRFVDTKLEANYRQWRSEQNLTVTRLGVASPVPVWLVTPEIGYWWLPQVDWHAVWRFGYLLVVPTLLLVLALTYSPRRAWSTAASAWALVIAGCTMIWTVTVRIPDSLEVSTLENLGPAAALTVLMASFALFLRLPPISSVLATAPFVLPFVAYTIYRLHAGGLPAIYGYAFVTTLACTGFFIAAISIVGERFFRSSYIDKLRLGRAHQALCRSSAMIRRYVPAKLAERIEAGESTGVERPERRRVTIVFSDIVGFTDLADRIDPESLTEFVGEYMSSMTSIVDRNGGVVNEFSGDGLMCMFGSLSAMDAAEHAKQALVAAREMQSALAELNSGWKKRFGFTDDVKVRVGLNTGVVAIGSYGSQGRMTFTGIGLQTNIAARVQSQCEPGQLLMTQNTYALVADHVRCIPVKEAWLKGVHHPIRLYTV